ncbi:histidinol-phosphate transaminase [Desulfonatronospira sp.]|uniref:histidinol-phosphate transaminase n=1 Tax=Desulfonatronospira sp. TaxID=1962951 RepID=UPI0025BC5E5B|nr:histidinol-phosphate transaminase [Desulfonatronospira sp.]
MSEQLSRLIRNEVKSFKPYSPGLGIDEIKKKYGLSRVIKMASNENPLGVSPLVQETISSSSGLAFRYPGANNPELCLAVARHLGLDPACIVCGNGSDELIDLLIRMLSVPGRDNIVAFNPCFSIYRLQARLSGVEFRQAELNPDFSFAFKELLNLVDDKTRVVFLTNPDNPSGYAAPASELHRFASKLPQGCCLVVDEAYIDFADPLDHYSMLSFFRPDSNLVVLRTFSKMYALAGLRLGYAILPVTLADYMRRIRLPFSVNILAEKAGQAALKDSEFTRQSLAVITRGREFLSSELKNLGCKVYSSQANFIMFYPPVNAGHIFQELLKRGIIIRPLDSYGFAHLLRVSIGTAEENEIFIKYMQEVMG